MLIKKSKWKRCRECKQDHEVEPEVHGCDHCKKELKGSPVSVVSFKMAGRSTTSDWVKLEFCSAKCAAPEVRQLLLQRSDCDIHITLPAKKER